MEELIFIKKKVGRSETDVSVNTTHSKSRGNNVSIIFRNNVHRFITMGKSEFVVLALIGERIYFKYSDERDGWKLSKNGSNGTEHRYVSLSENVAPAFYKFCETHTGDYALKYDDDRNLHYIDCE